MLSAQADELRDLALWLDDEFYDEYATRAREAADTILSLRDKAQELQAENAKLRDLARAAWKCIHSGLSCSDCRLIACGCTLQSAMRELGIEVG
jgi:predicted outer membrane protein